MSRRALRGALVAGLLLGLAPVGAAVAADPVDQTLDLGTVATARTSGTTWVPTPVTPTTMPLTIVLDGANAPGVCSLNGDGDGVDLDNPGSCTVHVTAPADATYAASNTVDVTFTIKDPQTLDLGSPTLARTSGTTWTPTPVGTTTSPLTITLDGANTAGACTLASGTVSFDAPGTCTVHVQAPADGTRNASNTVDTTFTVKDPQTLDLGTVATARVSGTSWTPTAVGTNSSPLTITLDAGNTAGVCSLSSGSVSFDGHGSCLVHVQAPADGTRNASNTVDTTFTVKDSQSLDLGTVATSRTTGGTWVPAPVTTTTTPLVIELDAGNAAGVCSADDDGDGVDFDGPGTCLVHVTAPADATHAVSNTVDVTFVVKDPQTLDLGSPTLARTSGTTWTPTPVGTNSSPLTITLDGANTAGACTLASGTVSFDAPGTCTVHVQAPADGTRNASNTVDTTFTVKDPQTLDLGTVATARATGTTWTPTAVGTTTSPLTVVLDAGNAGGVCSLSSGAVRFDAPGTCLVHVTAPADGTRNASNTVDVSFTVKHPQTPTVTVAAGTKYAGARVTPTVTTSYGAVTLVSLTTGTCTIDGSEVVLVKATTCTVQAQAAGDATHLPGNGQTSFTVTPRPVTVAVTTATAGPFVYGGTVVVQAVATPTQPTSSTPLAGSGTITITAPESGDEVLSTTYTFNTGSAAGVSFDAEEVGDYDVTVTFTPDSTGVYATSSGSTEVAVGKAPQVITITDPAPAGTLYVGQTWATPATNSVAANTPSLSVSTSAVCQVASGGIRFLKTGTCTFDADRSATTHYLAGHDSATVTVALRPVSLEVGVTTADPVDDVPRYAGAATLTLTARDVLSGAVVPVNGTGTVQVVGQDASPRAVTFTNGVATASWSPAAVGDHDVLVAFTPNAVSGTPTYATVAADAAHPTDTITVQQARQAIGWGTAPPSSSMVDTTWATGATGGASGQPVVLTSLTPSTCTVSGLTVTFVAATVTACQVEATQAGTTNYAATSRTASVTVTTRPVDVTVAWPSGAHVYGAPVVVTVTATDRTSGTPVPDEDDDPSGTGIVSFGTETLPVTFHDGVGTVTFTPTDVRTYAVSSTFTATRTLAYTAATPTAVDLEITQAPQSIAIATPAPTSPTKNEIWRPGATGGGSGNAVTLAAGPNATCTDGTDGGGAFVEFKKHGACTITFTQAGNTYYLAGSRTVEIDVAKVGVLLTLDVPSASRTYGQQVVVSAAATSKKDAGTPVPGTVTITVTDLTPTTPVVVAATSTVVDPATGTATATFAGGTLLAGTFDVEATFVPTVADDFDEATVDDTVTVVRAPQTVTLTSAAAPSSGRVTDTWTPTFATPASGGTVGLEVRAAQSVPSAQPDYAGDPTYTPPATTCSVSSGVLRLDAQGSCRVDAVAPAVARTYDEGRIAIADVTVTRIPVDVTLSVTSPTAPTATGPVVGEEVQVRVTAKVDGKAMPGYGPLTVTDPHGAALTDVPSATGSWFGGGRFYSFIPEVGGDPSTTYAVATTFRPTDRVTYQTTTKQATVQVDKAAQAIHLTQPQPTSVPVRDRWTPVATGGSSGQPITLGIDPSSSLRAGSGDYVCEVAGSEIVFEGHGTCVVTLSQAGTTDGYLPATLTTDPIEVYQTGVVVTLDVPASAQVGVPTTITATATAGGLPVAGSGPLTLHSAGGALVESVSGTWTGGKQTLAFTPTHAGADMVVAADFTPTDAAAYSDPALVDDHLSVATGVQTVAFTTGHDGTAWVGESWTPGPVATGSTTTPAVQLSAPTGACELDAGVVSFVHAGSCTLGLDLAAVAGTYAAEDWSAAPHVEQTVVVSAHPTEVVLDEPVETDRRVSQDLTLVAQVVGHDSGNASTEHVEGTVRFTVDGTPYGDPVAVDVSGIATGTVRVVLGAGDEEVVDHVLGAVFTPTDAVYWAGDDATVDVEVERNDQNFVGDLVGPGSLRVGRTWTPAVTASSGGPVSVDVTDDSAAVCTVAGGTVTITAAAPDDDVCTVLLDQAGDTVYAPIQVRPLITATLNPTAVVLTLPDAEVGHPATIQAAVSAPGAVDPAPAGTVTFTVDGVPLATDVPVVGGTASASLTPGTALDRTVVATFTPTATTTYAPATLARTLDVDPTPTTTTVESITAAGIAAQVVAEEDADTALSGQVVFSYTTAAAPDATQVLGTGTLDAAGRASTSAMPPATQEVTVWATYAGDRDHASSDGSRRRGLPTITPHVDGTLTGWNTEPVTITFTCARDTAALATDCPGKAVRGADGKNQSVTVDVTARDGARRTLTVSGIDVDRTGPVVGITGTEPGAWYTGSAPPASCSKARDALSGLASCTVKRVVGSGRTRTDVATATDKAGNTSVERVTYQVWDHWIAKAPLRGTAFQVKPGTTQQLVAITYGAKPQLMLPDAAGKLQPGPVFKASRIDDGVITWVADLTVPKKLKAGSTYRFGFRLGGRAAVTKVTLDVVRRPSGQRASRVARTR